MHLSDSKREFFAPRGGREICMVGPLSLNGNAAAADKVTTASNSNAVFCNGTFTYDIRIWGMREWVGPKADKSIDILHECDKDNREGMKIPTKIWTSFLNGPGP